MPKQRCFLDLDYTLYDTDQLIRLIQLDMRAHGHSVERIQETLQILNTAGYSFERHLTLLQHPAEDIEPRAERYRVLQDEGDTYLYPGVAESIPVLATIAECHLLTYGSPPYQQRKFAGIPALHPHLPPTQQHYVWSDRTKGEVIHGFGADAPTWFLDDSPVHLVDALAKAPWTRCVRICHPTAQTKPDARDGSLWPVVTSLAEFVQLVRGGE